MIQMQGAHLEQHGSTSQQSIIRKVSKRNEDEDIQVPIPVEWENYNIVLNRMIEGECPKIKENPSI